MKSFIRVFIACLLAIFVSLGILYWWGNHQLESWLSDKGDKLDSRVLTIKNINQQSLYSEHNMPFREKLDPVFTFEDLKGSIRHAESNPDIEGIVLELPYSTVSMARIEELRELLLDFKQSGKWIWAYGEQIGQGAYYLGSVADSIFIHPNAYLAWTGLSANVIHFKQTLDKLKINLQVFSIGNYKSAVEPFTRDKLSAYAVEQLESLLNGLYTHFVNQVSAARGLHPDSLHYWAENLQVFDSPSILKKGLADKEINLENWNQKLRKKSRDKQTGPRTITKYFREHIKDIVIPHKIKEDHIAILFMKGDIVNSGNEDQSITENASLAAIRKIKENEKVKGVVLRIESPGGSAFTSKNIYDALNDLKSVKPIVVSMGSVAASGGYEIACLAERIFAQPNTITGSIGVFGMWPDISRAAKTQLGITNSVVKTHEHADFGSIWRAFNVKERKIIEEQLKTMYLKFKRLVAEGRKMSVDEVEMVAQGKVFTGMQALQAGLVDEIGGLEKAKDYLAEKLNLDKFAGVSVNRPASPLDALKEVAAWTGQKDLGMYLLKEGYSWVLDESIYCRLPYELEINW